MMFLSDLATAEDLYYEEHLLRKTWEIAWDLWSHLLEILHSLDSLNLERTHELLNARIDAAFAQDRTLLPPEARRWFSWTPSALHPEASDYKELPVWLEAVSAFYL